MIRECLRDAPFGQDTDLAGILGDRDEQIGRDKAAFCMPPATEGLDRPDHTVGSAHLGLVVERDVPGGDRLAHL